MSFELELFPFALDGEVHEIAVRAFDDFDQLRPGGDLLAFCGDDFIVGAHAGAIGGHAGCYFANYRRHGRIADGLLDVWGIAYFRTNRKLLTGAVEFEWNRAARLNFAQVGVDLLPGWIIDLGDLDDFVARLDPGGLGWR